MEIANAKLQRIARDLDKIPCELQEYVLADLEFHQLVRLSSCASPSLVSSLRHSPTRWARYFRHGNLEDFQKLLAITIKTAWLDTFEFGKLSFLHYIDSLRKIDVFLLGDKLRDDEQLCQHWLSTLNDIVLDRTWSAFHENHDRLIEPWVSDMLEARQVFEKVPYVGVGGQYSSSNKRSFWQHMDTKTLFDVNELTAFVTFCDQIRLKRAESLAGELLRLANIYEAYPTLLKMPFDPRDHAPQVFNPKHMPVTMRRQARTIIRRSNLAHWKNVNSCEHRFVTPALVPYEWSVHLFNKVVQQPGFLDGDMAGVSNSDQHTEAAMIEKCRSIVASAPSWAVGAPGTPSGATMDADAVANLSSALSQQHLGSHSTNSAPIRVRVQRVRSADWKRLPMLPRGNEEVDWLVTFAEVTSWMVQQFPGLLEEDRKD